MNRYVLGFGLAAVVWALSGAVMLVLLLLELRRLAPRIRGRLTAAPEWVREHVPESLPPRRFLADLDTMRDDLHRMREALEAERAEREGA